MTTVENLKFRYAVKRFNCEFRITQKEVEYLTECIRLSPSSFGLQPYRVLVIQDQKVKEALYTHSRNQKQVPECSCLFVFCIYRELREVETDDFAELTARVRMLDEERCSKLKYSLKGLRERKSPEELKSWMARQCYIALAFLLEGCAELKLDSCPMEGFDPEGYSRILSLEDKNLLPVVLAAVGKHSHDDTYRLLEKVRKSSEDLFHYL